MFTLSYCLFEIPTGALGDRIGPRRVLTRVVLWWSAFTSLTGMVSNYYILLLTRFCFGAGEAGAFPNASVVGLMNTAAQVGGLLSSVAYGYIVDRFNSYDAPFVPMAALLFLGSLLWLKIDASTELTAGE